MAYGYLNDIMKLAPKYAQGLVLTLQLRHAEQFNSKSDYHLGYRIDKRYRISMTWHKKNLERERILTNEILHKYGMAY